MKTSLLYLLAPAFFLTVGYRSVGFYDAGNLPRPALNFKATGARALDGTPGSADVLVGSGSQKADEDVGVPGVGSVE